MRVALEPFRTMGVSVVSVVSDLHSVMSAVDSGAVASVAIDMPIGLPTTSARPCDSLARDRLGPRRSSIFPAPQREVLSAGDHAEANSITRRLAGRGLSIQSWNLVPKIRELDALLTPDRQEVVRESHPELAFTRLGGAPMAHNKRTSAGRAERLEVLGYRGLDELPTRPAGAASDDLIDAMVLTHTAIGLLDDAAWTLGGELDERGLRMEICG